MNRLPEPASPETVPEDNETAQLNRSVARRWTLAGIAAIALPILVILTLSVWWLVTVLPKLLEFQDKMDQVP